MIDRPKIPFAARVFRTLGDIAIVTVIMAALVFGIPALVQVLR